MTLVRIKIIDREKGTTWYEKNCFFVEFDSVEILSDRHSKELRAPCILMANINKEQYIFSEQKCICFLTSCQNAIRLTGISEYTSRYLRKDYTPPQPLTLLLFKEYLGENYWNFVQLVEIMAIIQDQLELKEIPHYSTLCKISKRISSTVLNQIYRKACSFMSEWKHRTTIVAIDSSGFTPDSASTYTIPSERESPVMIILKRPSLLIPIISPCYHLM